MWLQGTTTVALVMIVKLKEDPVYKCPFHHYTEEQVARMKFPPPEQISGHHFLLSSPHGPAAFKGLTWVGEVKGFFEFWGTVSGVVATCVTQCMVSYSLRGVVRSLGLHLL